MHNHRRKWFCLLAEQLDRQSRIWMWFPRFSLHLTIDDSFWAPTRLLYETMKQHDHSSSVTNQYWKYLSSTSCKRPCLSNERVLGILIWVLTNQLVRWEGCDVSKDSLSRLYLHWRLCFHVPNVFIVSCSPALCRALHQTVLTSTLLFGIFCCSKLVDARIYSARHPLSIGAGQAGTPEW